MPILAKGMISMVDGFDGFLVWVLFGVCRGDFFFQVSPQGFITVVV